MLELWGLPPHPCFLPSPPLHPHCHFQMEPSSPEVMSTLATAAQPPPAQMPVILHSSSYFDSVILVIKHVYFSSLTSYILWFLLTSLYSFCNVKGRDVLHWLPQCFQNFKLLNWNSPPSTIYLQLPFPVSTGPKSADPRKLPHSHSTHKPFVLSLSTTLCLPFLELFFATDRNLICLSVMMLKKDTVQAEINWEEQETLLYILSWSVKCGHKRGQRRKTPLIPRASESLLARKGPHSG